MAIKAQRCCGGSVMHGLHAGKPCCNVHATAYAATVKARLPVTVRCDRAHA